MLTRSSLVFPDSLVSRCRDARPPVHLYEGVLLLASVGSQPHEASQVYGPITTIQPLHEMELGSQGTVATAAQQGSITVCPDNLRGQGKGVLLTWGDTPNDTSWWSHTPVAATYDLRNLLASFPHKSIKQSIQDHLADKIKHFPTLF